MATVHQDDRPLQSQLTPWVLNFLEDMGELSLFGLHVLAGIPRRTARRTLLPVSFAVGIQSIPVVLVTGMFIGMVLAVQSYGQFHQLGLETQLGAIINVSVVRELGPVLVGIMLAGRTGSAMAAELATMRTTEQIDAIACLGTDPSHYLVTPRLMACTLLVPFLSILGDFTGVLGGALISLHVYHIEPHYYWENTRGNVELWDFFTGIVKSTAFGASIAIISCQRGMHSETGAEGVGKAATRAFVASFIAILALDFFLGLFLYNVHEYFYPVRVSNVP